MSRYPLFDRSRIRTLPLADRVHKLEADIIKPLTAPQTCSAEMKAVGNKIKEARINDRAVIMFMGAHVIRSGVQKYIIDMMEKGLISCLSMNGAGVIHDYEFALIGATTEDVEHYISEGRFGLWNETGGINEIVNDAYAEGLGIGEAVGRVIEEEKFSRRDISLLAAGHRFNIPVTVHVGIGCDIVHEHPNCNGAAYGQASYTDFLCLAHVMEKLENGVIMNFGSAVTAPEVFLKALAMVRNVGGPKSCRSFTSLVCDLKKLPDDYRTEASEKEPDYYFRPWKTMLVRTVADGGESFFVRGRHSETVPQLWAATV